MTWSVFIFGLMSETIPNLVNELVKEIKELITKHERKVDELQNILIDAMVVQERFKAFLADHDEDKGRSKDWIGHEPKGDDRSSSPSRIEVSEPNLCLPEA